MNKNILTEIFLKPFQNVAATSCTVMASLLSTCKNLLKLNILQLLMCLKITGAFQKFLEPDLIFYCNNFYQNKLVTESWPADQFQLAVRVLQWLQSKILFRTGAIV